MKEGGGGEKPSNPYVIPVTSQGFFCVGLCWDLGMLRAMIDITSEHNVNKNKKISYFQLFWADLTWLCPWDDLTMTLA